MGSRFALGGREIVSQAQHLLDLLLRERTEKELQAARSNCGEQKIGIRSEQNQRGRFGRLFQDLEEDVGVIPAHCVRAVDNKNALFREGFEIRSALHRPQLADVQDGSSHRVFQPYRIGNNGPDVRVRFQQQRNALDGRRVRAFSALGKPLRYERPRVLQPGDRPATGAFAAEIVSEPLAIRRLREHSRQREFSHSSRPRE